MITIAQFLLIGFGYIQFTVNGIQPNTLYDLESSNDLCNWSVYESFTSDGDSAFFFIQDYDPTRNTFYRIHLTPQP